MHNLFYDDLDSDPCVGLVEWQIYDLNFYNKNYK
jgi:hypothetical protein